MSIYLDNAATTRLDEAVLEAMAPYLTTDYANASAIHNPGQKNNLVLEDCRHRVASHFKVPAENIYFTSGASESNNWIIKGLMFANQDKGKHLLISAIEHPCVLRAAEQLTAHGYEVELIPVKENGLLDLEALKKMLRPDTVLVSVMAVNNEMGALQDLKAVADIVHEAGAYFHSDIVQAIPYLDLNLPALGVDFASLSAHKFYGPKGVGAAYIKSGVKIESLIAGGEQEGGRRAGTYNLPGIVGLAAALDLVYSDRDAYLKKVKDLRDYFWERLQAEIPEVVLNGDLENRTPNNLNVLFRRVEGEAILIDLSEKGIYVSTGSACSAHNLKSSYVLSAIGRHDEDLNSNIRFTLGRYNTKVEIDETVAAVKETVARLRGFTPIKK
ncbi:MAG: cysteine desulfurase family protein [Petrimonas sp.]|nr:cysteine desulfurase family protein [Petrimonas sp.]